MLNTAVRSAYCSINMKHKQYTAGQSVSRSRPNQTVSIDTATHPHISNCRRSNRGCSTVV